MIAAVLILVGAAAGATVGALAARKPAARVGTHRHVLGRHKHPDWHGHCDPSRRGFKRCERPHWHLWWRHADHSRAAAARRDGVWFNLADDASPTLALRIVADLEKHVAKGGRLIIRGRGVR